MMPDLNAIALFVRVIEHKSFTETSRQLGIPISTISRKVSDLEKNLGIRLIERSTRSLRLTENGQEYFQYCRRGLEEIEAGLLLINNKQSEVAGTLRISIPPNIADVLVMPLVCGYQKIYPKAKIKMLVTERDVDLIEDGVDIALRVGALEDSSLIARQLLRYRHLLVASPKYIKAHGELRHPDELCSHRLLTFTGWFGQTSWELFNKNNVCKIFVESAMSINEMSGLQFAAENHQGIANLPAILCDKPIKNGTLIEVIPDWRFAPTTLSAMYPSNRNTSRLVKLFTDYCVKHIKKQSLFTGL
ncbi:Transcriptional regulator, LysR family [hydrothermal vent metagenome]|uniref:Transcriptional regulator, LysR family n=1 Tax=hydrothermal vent metagenome TaxID=652676 RepID=A0A3B0WHQ0_9ZZZZ